MKASWKRGLSLAAAALIPLAVLPALITFAGGLRQVRAEIAGITPGWLAVALAAGAALQAIRALRFRELLGQRIGLERLFPVVCVHYFANRVLPLRTGEISFVLLAKRYGQVSLGRSAFSLAVVRLLDFTVLCLVYVICSALMILVGGMAAYRPLLVPMTAAALIAVPVALALRYPAALLRMLDWPRPVLRGCVARWWDRLTAALSEPARDLQSITWMTRLRLFLYSMAVWSLMFGTSYSILRALQIRYSVVTLVVGSMFAHMGTILPVSGWGNFGSMELLWTAGYALVGVNQAEAVAGGFGVNVFTFVITLVLGAAAMVYLKLTDPPRKSLEELEDRKKCQ